METKEVKFSMYSVLPTQILLDTEISAQSKLYYGAISSLCNFKGYCWATNSYLANIFHKTERTVQNCLEELKNKGYLQIEINQEIGNKRKIYLKFLVENNLDK